MGLLPSVTNERMKMDESIARSRHPDSLAQAFLWALLPTLLLVLNAPDASYAQVVTNITPTTDCSSGSRHRSGYGWNHHQITGGTRPNNGTNLFHSFDSFTLGTDDTAHFLNDMQLPTTNIFGRVIGGEISRLMERCERTILSTQPIR